MKIEFTVKKILGIEVGVSIFPARVASSPKGDKKNRLKLIPVLYIRSAVIVVDIVNKSTVTERMVFRAIEDFLLKLQKGAQHLHDRTSRIALTELLLSIRTRLNKSL
jgi:hypothetical protein